MVELEELKTEADPDLQALAVIDYEQAQARMDSLLSDLQKALLPSPETDQLNALLEIKAGVGGAEAGLFAGDLLRMYSKLSSRNQWRVQIADSDVIAKDAYRMALLEIHGKGAYGTLKHEIGVHRVQRVPSTESTGRTHTSTATVIVFPISENKSNGNVEDVDERDLKIEVMRASGAGGQHVNRTESAVRMTHLPTGITVSMQDSRSQHANKAKALLIIRARVMDARLQREAAQRRAKRRAQVQTADRSEKVRTYNYTQDRVTDHRMPLSINGLENVMEGGDKLDVLLDALHGRDLAERLDDLKLEEN